MSFHECKLCHGQGTTGMHGAFEDAEVCCDQGGSYSCDSCDSEIDPSEDMLTVCDNHYCDECKHKFEEEGA